MKLSICVLAATATAAPWGMDDENVIMKPTSGKPMSGRPHSGHHNKEDMKEEYGEFKDMMAGVNQQNMMNVNFAPINNNAQNWVNINTQFGAEFDMNVNSPSWGKDGKDWEKDEHKDGHKDEHHDEHHDEHDDDKEVDWNSDKMMWLKEKLMEKVKEAAMWKLYAIYNMMAPHEQLIKELIENMTGKDCDEWKVYLEETFMDGHSFEQVAMWYRDGQISEADLKMWAKEICDGVVEHMGNMSEEESEQKMAEMKEYLAMFGIDAEKIKEGFETWMGMSFEMLQERIENPDFNGDMIQPRD